MWFFVSGKENIGHLSGFKNSLCGRVVFNPNFPGRQITGSHGIRFVVNSLVSCCNLNSIGSMLFFYCCLQNVLSLYCISISMFHVLLLPM